MVWVTKTLDKVSTDFCGHFDAVCVDQEDIISSADIVVVQCPICNEEYNLTGDIIWYHENACPAGSVEGQVE